VLTAALAVLPGVGEPAAPAPIRGPAISGKTGLRLLVADDPPFLLNVDSGRVSRVNGIPEARHGTVSVVGVSGRSAIVLARTDAAGRVYGVLGRSARVAPLGVGRLAWPGRDGVSAWIQAVDGSRCTLRRVALGGRLVRARRPFPCATVTDPSAASLGIVVRRTSVFEPLTGRRTLRTRFGILAATGKTLVLAGPDRQLILRDGDSGRERRVPWPSTLGGLDEIAVDPSGWVVAVAFADPAAQVLDVWLLDVQSGLVAQLPGMPAVVELKRTSMAWTDDSRLVFLARSGGRDVVATWRLGRDWLAIKPMKLPERRGGSDSFALLR
jgi:hypothetical protein